MPASISIKRRSISADHAASTSGSDIGSTVVPGISSSPLHASSSLRTHSAAVSFGVLVHLHGSTTVAGVLKGPLSIDVLVEVTSELLVRISIARGDEACLSAL